jgi:hypothetical protein
VNPNGSRSSLVDKEKPYADLEGVQARMLMIKAAMIGMLVMLGVVSIVLHSRLVNATIISVA